MISRELLLGLPAYLESRRIHARHVNTQGQKKFLIFKACTDRIVFQTKTEKMIADTYDAIKSAPDNLILMIRVFILIGFGIRRFLALRSQDSLESFAHLQHCKYSHHQHKNNTIFRFTKSIQRHSSCLSIEVNLLNFRDEYFIQLEPRSRTRRYLIRWR